jgi:predicted component of type VI protein secretion system
MQPCTWNTYPPHLIRFLNAHSYSDEELRQGLDMGVAQIIDTHPDAPARILSAREYIRSNEVAPMVKKMCVNENENCTLWSAMGECER